MKNIYFLFLFTAFAKNLNAQNLITVQHGSTATFYTDLQASITAAQDGDFIYIPGGTFGTSGQIINVNKRLNIYGSGSLVDSSSATGVTYIGFNLKFNSNSNNSYVTGCRFNSPVSVGYDTCIGAVSNVTFVYNYFAQLSVYRKAGNITLMNNVFNNCSFLNTENFTFANNIIFGILNIASYYAFQEQTYGIINNNFIKEFTSLYSGVNSTSSNIILKNNYINNISGSFNNSTFLNNFSGSSITGYGATNTYINNQTIGGLNLIFINVPSAAAYVSSNNYHIITTSPAHNAGDDGTDIGIYGGSHPWKEGLVPANPHIRFSNINSQTGAGGNLPVNIKVGAQDH